MRLENPLKPTFTFKWNDTIKLFIVKQYAEFYRAKDICENIIIAFPELCEEDIDNHGEEAFKAYIIKTVYKLTPDTVVFPERFRNSFEMFREEYLKDFNNTYLMHSKNRAVELDKMFEQIMSDAVNAPDSAERKQLFQLGLNVIKESRAEQSSNKIRLEATSDGKEITLTASGAVTEMSDSQIEELMKQHESGESINLPGTAELLPSPQTGDGESEEES